ncbi:hypothetical protein RSOLAG1IB_05777 [Rhizoctonia solani AG-1 IB]|uniref:Uncharacterized protein n=1 Tax=Thanatephorus cucumeris (strain AG1-IB / isolate 7/3/14) TaxID=1108050 RepID=A0A0B7F8N6_THACB|nr:hypothetical protein RSOLAG1IB_05777 [Rhizoctonia solani AG-1 IB]
MCLLLSALALLACSALGFASPLQSRAAPDNTVLIRSESDYCLILPRRAGATVGESETPGGMQAFCSPSAQSDPSQGKLPTDFWRSVTLARGTGASGQSWVQLTGCINVFSQLNSNDGGGQYDSSGGDGGRGNPEGSACEGYNHYVELLEPGSNRACLRCCQDYNDCPLSMDTSGCPAVIPGNYDGC